MKREVNPRREKGLKNGLKLKDNKIPDMKPSNDPNNFPYHRLLVLCVTNQEMLKNGAYLRTVH